ncbi:hypothetical protein M4951_11720 [Blastopirellula sp. J2-11]|uniref:hypothetical protein n=1 Tax=Blastopirellula sp. J2-11 TaxID=2943192 RepID=UPI0021C92177|nr:hypothetical protein [Blastopirellula sp. J2-11]UUO08960.1 hypothetical protein M4951_11720 [Blastopirellula sp. J2-11]
MKSMVGMWRICAPLALMSLFALGCSRGPETFAISGQVTLDGKPLHSGSVVFSPIDGSEFVASGKVVDGSYKLDCISGEKLVQIGGYTAEMKVVPVTYVSEASGLTASVTEDGEISFDLQSKRSRRR